MLTDLDIYLFDLRGYLLLENALSADEVAALNAGIDAILPLKHGEWYGYVHGHTFGDSEGTNLQQIYEAGAPFERLIDHPAWIDKVKHFVGGEGTFDYNHGPLFIDENFANIRGPGEAIGLHSGGHEGVKRTQFRVHNGRFHCGQINILMALTDIGPGDGATMVIPGSHKANFAHPDFARHRMGGEVASVDNVAGAIEVHMRAGDALLFVDAISHGSAKRTNPGERRIIVYRYGPSWGNFRHGYQPSPELLARLTPERRQIVQPLRLLPREPQKVQEGGKAVTAG
ncbi:MAG: hypothetical protein Kow00120_15460 [Anaerolineae bacterium]